jgi:hypothetical protein
MGALPQRPILVISPDWQTRALLGAQLSETTDHGVVPTIGVDAALALLEVAPLDPALVIVDAGRQANPENIDALMAALPETPVILVVSALHRAYFTSWVERSAVFLTRPVSIGSIADSAAAVLHASASPQDGPAPEAQS